MKIYLTPLVGAALLSFAGSAAAQKSATVTGVHATAKVVCPITIGKQSDLNFGTVVSGNGTAHVTSGGTESYTGNIKPGTQVGTHTAAEFAVTGESGFSYSLTTSPASGILAITDGSGHSASVQLDAAVPSSGTLGTLSCGSNSGGDDHEGDDHEGDDHEGDDEGGDGNNNTGCGCGGTQSFIVGGVLTEANGQIPGLYKNTNTGGTPWLVTVAYN